MTAISVLVPTYRRPALLDRCLASLAAQDLPVDAVQVVAVDDGSDDATQDVLVRWGQRMPNLVALTQPANAGPAAARNRGIDAAQSDVVLFIDDDIVAPPGLARAHLELHQASGDPHLGILGRVDWHPDLRVTPFMRWLDGSGLQFGFDTWLREGPVVPPAAAFYTCNLSMRADLLRRASGFDERFPYPAYEDMELAWRLERLGFRLEYRPDALAWHARAIDLRTFRDRMAKVAQSATLLARIQPDFPLDDAQFDAPVPGWRRRAMLRLRAWVGDDAARARWYRAAVATGYAAGRATARGDT